MKVKIRLNNDKLKILNDCMVHLDTICFESVSRRLKSSVAICMELRNELLQKSVKNRLKTTDFEMKVAYYKADAMYNYLQEFEIYFPDSFSVYEWNTIRSLREDLHQKLL